MADDSATFDFSGLAELHKRMAAALQDMSPSMRKIADMLVDGVHENWDAEGQGTWPPLAPSTLAHKGGDYVRMLFETGDAYDSVLPVFGPKFGGAESDDPKLPFHLSSAPRSKIPLRDPFDLPDLDARIDAGISIVLDALMSFK